MSVEILVNNNGTNLGTTPAAFIKLFSGSEECLALSVHTIQSSKLLFNVYSGPATLQGYSFPLTGWHHIVFTRDSIGTHKFWSDAVPYQVQVSGSATTCAMPCACRMTRGC